MISEEEIKHIAKLARLELAEIEIKKMQKDLSKILDYFNLLKEIPNNIEIFNFKTQIQNLRKDETVSSHNIVDELIGSVPDKKDDYIKVKNVF